MEQTLRSLANGRFSITRPLGEGGMAEVWEAYDHTLEAWRAIKFIHKNLVSRKSVVRRFTAEAHAMARLEHPNVVRIYDVGDDDGIPYLVMELANGGSIENYLARHGKMDVGLALDVMMQVCAGVQAAHNEGIIHRDLKPDNILIDRRGVCKVTDFGIARLQETDSRTRTGSIMGTLAYMAPEQRANAKGIEVTADVFALTATLYSMLSGEVPTELFMAEHHPQLMDPIPEVLRPILLEGLRYDPKQRTPSVQALQDALASIRGDLPTPEVPVPPLIKGNTANQTVPAQTRPPATDPGPAPVHRNHRNVPDTLEGQEEEPSPPATPLPPPLHRKTQAASRSPITRATRPTAPPKTSRPRPTTTSTPSCWERSTSPPTSS